MYKIFWKIPVDYVTEDVFLRSCYTRKTYFSLYTICHVDNDRKQLLSEYETKSKHAGAAAPTHCCVHTHNLYDDS